MTAIILIRDFCNKRFVILDANGDPKMRMVWSKAVKDYRLRKVYAKKTFVFRQQLLKDMLDRALHTTLDYTSRRVSSSFTVKISCIMDY